MRRPLVAAQFVVVALLSAAPVHAQVTTGTIVGTVSDPNGDRSRRHGHHSRGEPAVRPTRSSPTAPAPTPRRFSPPAPMRSKSASQGFKKWVRDGVILQVNQRARVDVPLEVGRHRGDHDGHRSGTAAPDRFVGGRHGHRRPGVQDLPLNSAELRDAGLPDARRHARTGGREPLGRQHLQPSRRVELQRARPSGQRQRLAHRRHRQQRVHVQHGHRRALGRAGARVQGADRRLLGRVRPRRRRRLGVDQVGHQRAARHRVRVLPRRRVRCAELLRAARSRADGAGRRSKAAAQPASVRRRRRRAARPSGPVRRAQPHLLLRRLRRPEGNARADVRQHACRPRGPRIGDFSDFRDASGQPDPHLRSADHAANPASTRPPVSATNPQFLRDPFPNNIIPPDRINTVGRNVASIYPLPNGAGQLRQLHVDRRTAR